jgi:hypothetical protein
MPRAVQSESYCPFEVYQPLIAAGQPFHDPAADAALFDALRRHVTVPIMELGCAHQRSEVCRGRC